MIISAGHKITLPTAVQLVLSCLKKYRIPEPTRYAHLAANQCRLTFSIETCDDPVEAKEWDLPKR